MTKTLSEYLFDSLRRLSEADKDTIELEMNKAHSIISVSKQIIDITRVKLDISRSGGTIVEFGEISDSQKMLTITGKNGKP